MTGGRTQKDKIDHDRKADDDGSRQKPLLFRHRTSPELNRRHEQQVSKYDADPLPY